MHLFLSLPLPGGISLRERGEIKAGDACVIKDTAWSSSIPCDTEAGVEGRTVTAAPSRGTFYSKTNPDNWRESPDAALLASLKLEPAVSISPPCFVVVSPQTCLPSSRGPKAQLFGKEGQDKHAFPGEQRDLEHFPSWKHEAEEVDTHPCDHLLLCCWRVAPLSPKTL